MDIHMRELEGYARTAEIRRREGRGKHTPIVAITANARPEDRENCLAAGMDDYLAKPVHARALALVLERWTANMQSADTEPANPDDIPPATNFPLFFVASMDNI